MEGTLVVLDIYGNEKGRLNLADYPTLRTMAKSIAEHERKQADLENLAIDIEIEMLRVD